LKEISKSLFRMLIAFTLIAMSATQASAQFFSDPDSSLQDDRPVIQLSGVIVNDTAKSLPFATVAIPNREKGTVSDFWGYYSIPVYADDTIRYSSVGYKKQVFIFPEDFEGEHYNHNVTLITDTIILLEAVVFPWNTYDQFLRAVVELELPEDDLARARKNIAMLQRQLISDEYQVDASLNYKYFMESKYNQAYTAGQYPSVSLLNPLAWAQFFEALKDGLFTKKNKIY
jgi:hypothetical protein